MEPSIPTSFIPKRPVTAETYNPERRKHNVGLLSFITVIIVVGTVLAYGGVYFYHQNLIAQKAKVEKSISAARDGIGTDFLADMKRLNARIAGVKTILQNHIVVSPIFDALQDTTLRSVQYKTFQYEFTSDPTTKTQLVKVKIDGTARTYSTIALQSDAFAQSKLIRNPIFSNLSIDDKTNVVNFQLTFEVDPASLSFQSFIDARNGSSAMSTDPAASVPPPAGATTGLIPVPQGVPQ